MQLLARILAPIVLFAAACTSSPATPAEIRAEVHLLRLDLEDLGDELVLSRPELAPRWEAAKQAADVAGAAWDAYLEGGSPESLDAALRVAVGLGEDLIDELAGDGSDTAAVLRAGLRIMIRRALRIAPLPDPELAATVRATRPRHPGSPALLAGLASGRPGGPFSGRLDRGNSFLEVSPR